MTVRHQPIRDENTVIRVLYISPGGAEGRGGIGRMARYLVKAFHNLGNIEVRVLDPYGPGAFFLMPFYFGSVCVQLAIACLTRRVDLVHLHMSHGGSALRKLALLRLADSFGLPTVLHIHGSKLQLFADGLSGSPRKIFLSCLRRSTRVVVIGTYWQKYLVEDLGLSSTQVAIIHNGVPLPNAIARAHDLGAPCRIVALGVLGQRKGTSDLLQALATPICSALSWQAIIAGNGEVEKYRAEATSHGLGGRVEFPGWVDAGGAQTLLAAADIFVLPSYNEGLPVAILEAMASELPIITTPVGAIPDIVQPNETGILCEPGNISELSAALAALMGDPPLRARLGATGRRAIEGRFTIDAVARQLVELYRAAIMAREA